MSCTKCGKCCIHAWPRDILTCLAFWTEEDVIHSFPICAVLRHPQYGGLMRGENFVWTVEHGLTRSETDPACPFLGLAPDGTRPCLLVGTKYEWVFLKYCLPHPVVNCG